jgi:hypothetical protein
MKVFISWSGEVSKKAAEAVRNWLPSVLQLVRPYFTPADVDKGTRWSTEIGKELESSEVGLLCITRDNLQSPWVMFEAGALSKSLDKAHVCPLLFGIQNTDLSGPLKQFQTTAFTKEEFQKLITVINGRLGENKLTPKVLDSVFEKWWPELEEAINAILADVPNTATDPVRTDRAILEELLELSRLTASTVRKVAPTLSTKAVTELLRGYVALCEKNIDGKSSYEASLQELQGIQRVVLYIAEHIRPMDSELKELTKVIKEMTSEVKKEAGKEEEDEDIPF